MARYTPGRSLTRSRKTPFVFDRSTPTPRHPPWGSTSLHPDGHAGLAVIEPVPGRDPTDRDEMATQFEGYLPLVRLDTGDVEVERARRGSAGRRHGDRAVGRTGWHLYRVLE
jgi:hypothetical protein